MPDPLLIVLLSLLLPPLALAGIYVAWVLAAYVVHARRVDALERSPRRYGLLRSVPFLLCEAFAMFLARVWAIVHRGRDRLRPPPVARGRPVLLVHGFFQNASGFRRLRRFLHARGRATHVVNLGRSFRPLEAYGAPLVAALRERNERDGAGGFDVVAHSMGGLVLRRVLADAPELGAGIATVVTLASPHHGTEGAVGLGVFPDVRAMQPGSAFLLALPGLRELLPHARIVTLSVERDTIVYPRATCHLRGCEPRHVHRLGHVGLIVFRRGHEALWAALEEGSDARARGTREVL